MRYLKLFIGLAFFFQSSELTFSQEKRSPDTFNGFREFEFYKPITDYFNYNYRKIEENLYEIVLPPSESRFLETRIEKILISTYKNQIYDITLLLEKDIGDILKRMFRHTTLVPRDSRNFLTYGYKSIKFRGVNYSCNEFSHPEFCTHRIYSHLYTSPIRSSTPKPDKFETNWEPHFSFWGDKTNMVYGCYLTIKTYYEKDPNVLLSYIEKKSISCTRFLSFIAVGFKEKIDSRQVQEHFDSYLSDFGVRNQSNPNMNKPSHRVPLFKMGNSFVVRAFFGSSSGEFVLDTGSDYIIISPDLYTRLKTKDLVTDLNSTQRIVLADGRVVNFKKVMIKDMEIGDLKIGFIEAFINTADVSLLGQNFLQRFGRITIDHRNNLLIIEK